MTQRLVKLIAPVAGCTFRLGDKDYAVGASGEIDVPEFMVRDLLAEGFKRAAASEVVLMQGPQGERGEIGLQGKQGPVGPPGPTGPRGPIGPMPRHQWEGTELRFEVAPGEWGAWVDLQGPKGEPGRDGGGGAGLSGLGAGPLNLDALGLTAGSSNSYFPSGW